MESPASRQTPTEGQQDDEAINNLATRIAQVCDGLYNGQLCRSPGVLLFGSSFPVDLYVTINPSPSIAHSELTVRYF